MRKVVEVIPSDRVFEFIKVSLKWPTLDTALGNDLFPAALRGNTVVMDYLTPIGRMRVLYSKHDVLAEIRKYLPFVEDVRLGKRRRMPETVNAGNEKPLCPMDVPVNVEGISDPELRQKFVRYVRIRRAWQEWRNS
ncbi:hypothetical protein HPY42_03360 [Coprothermobacteraceae bacterium]|nr:hypothetical protein [Coprothermobacteraceae bacterium]